MSDGGTIPMDGTIDGGGTWHGGKWYPAGYAPSDDPSESTLERIREDHAQAEAFRRTHHEPGSAEERYSRQMRFDKYLAMQQLLVEIAHCAPADNHAAHFGPRAQQILAGMVQPRGPAVRAAERSKTLAVLVSAYQQAETAAVAAKLHGDPEGVEAATLTIEALKAWESAHPPAALDPLLLP